MGLTFTERNILYSKNSAYKRSLGASYVAGVANYAVGLPGLDPQLPKASVSDPC